MEEKLDLRKTVDLYLWQVRDVEKGLQALANEVDELRTEAEDYQKAKRSSEADLKRLGDDEKALQDERESLMRQHSEASFEQDTAKLQAISRRRVALDEELGEVRENIRGLNVTEHRDFSKRAASLKVRHEELKQRLPSIQMLPMHVEVLPSFLKAIYDAMQADSQRLREEHSAIKVPALYTSKQLEDLKREKGTSTRVDPAFARRQEHRRREWEKQRRINNINHNEKIRRGGGPATTGGEVREPQEVGNLAGAILEEVEAS